MLLSTQLHRGIFALPLLALFAMLALTAAVREPVQTASDLNLGALPAPRCDNMRVVSPLRLAMAPADLGLFAQRGARSCRA